MAVFALTAEFVSINSVDLSAYGVKAMLTIDGASLDTTNFGSAGWHAEITGIKSATLDLEFNDDFAASQVDATIWAAFGTTVPFEVRPTSAGRSATNPGFTGSCNVTKYNWGGQVGTLARKNIQIPVTGAVARQTS